MWQKFLSLVCAVFLAAIPLHAYAVTETTPEAVRSELPSGHASWQSFKGSCTIPYELDNYQLDLTLFYTSGKNKSQEVAKYDFGEEGAFWFLQVDERDKPLLTIMYLFDYGKVLKYDSSSPEDEERISNAWQNLDSMVKQGCPDIFRSMVKFFKDVTGDDM